MDYRINGTQVVAVVCCSVAAGMNLVLAVVLASGARWLSALGAASAAVFAVVALVAMLRAARRAAAG